MLSAEVAIQRWANRIRRRAKTDRVTVVTISRRGRWALAGNRKEYILQTLRRTLGDTVRIETSRLITCGEGSGVSCWQYPSRPSPHYDVVNVTVTATPTPNRLANR